MRKNGHWLLRYHLITILIFLNDSKWTSEFDSTTNRTISVSYNIFIFLFHFTANQYIILLFLILKTCISCRRYLKLCMEMCACACVNMLPLSLFAKASALVIRKSYGKSVDNSVNKMTESPYWRRVSSLIHCNEE